jgi:tripartite-type tricarboxylate transporter receptor subunit TctC
MRSATVLALRRIHRNSISTHPPIREIVIDNRSGAGGTIGAAEVARAKPDGYTLLVGTSSTHAINPTAMPNIAYDPVKDFTPISVLGTTMMAIVVHPSVPAKTLSQLVAHATYVRWQRPIFPRRSSPAFRI